jgi:hypothetical protein
VRVDGFGSDWKYVTVTRSILFIEHLMDWGVHWAVFEPSGERHRHRRLVWTDLGRPPQRRTARMRPVARRQPAMGDASRSTAGGAHSGSRHRWAGCGLEPNDPPPASPLDVLLSRRDASRVGVPPQGGTP